MPTTKDHTTSRGMPKTASGSPTQADAESAAPDPASRRSIELELPDLVDVVEIGDDELRVLLSTGC